jgi:hypothetical protein
MRTKELSLFTRTPRQLLVVGKCSFSLPLAALGIERNGKEAVEATCAARHPRGEKGAPRIGDKRAWSKRAVACPVPRSMGTTPYRRAEAWRISPTREYGVRSLTGSTRAPGPTK